MSVAGIIFSNIHDKNVSELTRMRTMASVPFGCRYRLIDFTLSNMVNAGISHVGVITHYNYQSLMDHLGSGKDWDLARREGGIQILPPYITAFANNRNNLYTTRLEALKSISSFISSCHEDYFVISDCDVICNIDLTTLIDSHSESGADITFAVKSMYVSPGAGSVSVACSDDNGRITDISESVNTSGGFSDVIMNIWVVRRKYLEDIIMDSVAHGYDDFMKDIINKNLKTSDFRIYRIEDYFAAITSIQDYYYCSMDLLNENTRKALFEIEGRPIYTKVRNSAPANYADGAVVHSSLVADGCHIEGTVENSILFRGVKVGKGTHIKNSILMQNTMVGSNCYLGCVITDKNAVIRDGRVLSGFETKPFYIEKGLQV